MNNNIIDHLQPTTILQRFYPTAENTVERLVLDSDTDDRLILLAHQNGIDLKKRLILGVTDEAVEITRSTPIGSRTVSSFCVTPSDKQDGFRRMNLRDILETNFPEVDALRNEPSYIVKKQLEEKLPIFTPCCVLIYEESCRTYYPIVYTCVMDFDILQDDNPNIDFVELKPALEALRHIYYCGRATNGIDLFCIVPISTPQRYAAHARALIHQFKKQGIIIRVADSITHTRTLSSDPSGYFNENAAEFTKFWD